MAEKVMEDLSLTACQRSFSCWWLYWVRTACAALEWAEGAEGVQEHANSGTARQLRFPYLSILAHSMSPQRAERARQVVVARVFLSCRCPSECYQRADQLLLCNTLAGQARAAHVPWTNTSLLQQSSLVSGLCAASFVPALAANCFGNHLSCCRRLHAQVLGSQGLSAAGHSKQPGIPPGEHAEWRRWVVARTLQSRSLRSSWGTVSAQCRLAQQWLYSTAAPSRQFAGIWQVWQAAAQDKQELQAEHTCVRCVPIINVGAQQLRPHPFC